MRTLAEAVAVAAFCGLLWIPVRLVTRRAAGHVLVQVTVYVLAAVATTAGAVALGAWRDHLRPTVTSVGATLAGMGAFWILVRLQTETRPRRDEVARSSAAAPDPAPAAPAAAPAGAPAATPVTPPATMTRRERREARHRFGRNRRRASASLG